MAKFKDLTGARSGRLTAVSLCEGERGWSPMWLCLCDCGVIKKIAGANIARGHTLSCGCLQREASSAACVRDRTTHGMAGNAEYCSWSHAKSRCINESNRAYRQYGGRGINFCDRWMNSFENFYADMGPKPGPEYSLDRFPNNDGNYEPGNCRWATKTEQARNTRSSVFLTAFGITKTMAAWQKDLGINIQTAKARGQLGNLEDYIEKRLHIYVNKFYDSLDTDPTTC